MIDYDMPLMEHDMKELRKKALTVKGDEDNEYIRYNEFLEQVRPKKATTIDMKKLEKLITRV